LSAKHENRDCRRREHSGHEPSDPPYLMRTKTP
jgi:hypothetical protein